jgi:hypothetical protein
MGLSKKERESQTDIKRADWGKNITAKQIVFAT